MCMDIQNCNFDAKDYFTQYYGFIMPTYDGLYPSFVIETNNRIEQYRTFLRLKYLFQSDDERVQPLETSLEYDINLALNYFDLIWVFKLMAISDIQVELMHFSHEEIQPEDAYYRYVALIKQTGSDSLLPKESPLAHTIINEHILVQDNTGIMNISNIYYCGLIKELRTMIYQMLFEGKRFCLQSG